MMDPIHTTKINSNCNNNDKKQNTNSSGFPIINQNGSLRRVGVEIELAGLDPEIIIASIVDIFGGKTVSNTPLYREVEQSDIGNIKVELDAQALQTMADDLDDATTPLTQQLFDWLTQAAEHLVPWEVVCPPVHFDQIDRIQSLTKILHQRGALGTKSALHYAFGVHFNPEIPKLESDTILNYLRAFFCLYDWICKEESIDIARKMTPYIDHFSLPYQLKIMDPDYRPDLDQLIHDYLVDNPTRNRSLDMLPLFAHYDIKKVKSIVQDDRIKPRPTFHYRLPNCDIDNPNWDLLTPWNHWLKVERLANNFSRLDYLQRQFLNTFKGNNLMAKRDWIETIRRHL